MSGTSMDGIDVAAVVTDGESDLVRGPFLTVPYDRERMDRIAAGLREAQAIVHRQDRPPGLAALERDLTHWHAEAVRTFLDTKLSGGKPDVIGFHGQTLLHRPQDRLTVQVGDGQLLSELTGIDVVNDFRAADVAAGGEGAPFVPVYHRALAATLPERPVVFVNIGGVANVTWIGRDGDLVAFDTGPGNGLVNDWMETHLGEAADFDGRHALKGSVNAAVLAALMDNPYFDLPPPKSLDRKSFSAAPVSGLSVADGAATLTRFTARSIAAARAHLPEPPELWIVCGGGRRNPALMAALAQEVGATVTAADAHGFDGDAVEAEAFAYMAIRSVRGLPLSFPRTTGVARPMTGGVLHTA
ncbi:MAG TPA: anhydro-N-acetylmuramic acid kinase [Aestuariivirgaceae bacterium]|nr:anhydro-N-acetylmuramic acid kinase [Aestuariivirgaceae bacterium]